MKYQAILQLTNRAHILNEPLYVDFSGLEVKKQPVDL